MPPSPPGAALAVSGAMSFHEPSTAPRHWLLDMTGEWRRQPLGTSSSACHSACWPRSLTTTTKASGVSPDWSAIVTTYFLCNVMKCAGLDCQAPRFCPPHVSATPRISCHNSRNITPNRQAVESSKTGRLHPQDRSTSGNAADGRKVLATKRYVLGGYTAWVALLIVVYYEASGLRVEAWGLIGLSGVIAI